MVCIPDPVVGACLQPVCNEVWNLGLKQVKRMWRLRRDLSELDEMLNRLREEVLKTAEDAHLEAAVAAAAPAAEQSKDAIDTLRAKRKELHRVADLYCYTLDDVEDWNAVLSTMCLGRVDLRCKITCGVNDLKQKLRNELEKPRGGTAEIEESRLNPETTSTMSEPFHGRAREVSSLIVRLLSGGGSHDAIPIVGMGGIGKSALARHAFNSAGVMDHFDHRIWVFVPYPGFDMCKVGEKIVTIVDIDTPGTSSRKPTSTGQEGLLRLVQERIRGKRILLVLDGVWCVEPTRWKEMMKVLAEAKEGSRILVTTQKEDVVREMEVCNDSVVCLDVLPEDGCRSMFSALAFDFKAAEKIDQASLDAIRDSFVSKCSGLPLIAKDLESRMRSCNVVNKREWEKVVNADLSKAKHNIFAPFLLSYCHQLSFLQKRCFQLCSVFPRNYEIQVDDLVAMWISLIHSMKLEGNLEDEALSCFDALRDRNMFRDFSKDYEGNVVKCKMHDAVREFARVFTKRNTDEPNTSQGSDEARYSTVVLKATEDRIPIDDKKNLHVLFVHHPEALAPNHLSCDALGKLPRLWTLHMHHCNINQLPNVLDKLLHLRYLNLSGNPLTELPESLCDLFNLLTLRLKDCSQLQSLPKEIGRLKKLRHLYIAGCSSLTLLPKGILECTELRVLDTFVVADAQTSEALKLGDLNGFTHLLRKIICIYRCWNLNDADLSSGAVIYRYDDLKLNFEGRVGTSGDRQEAIVQAREPSPELKSLEVRGFNGRVLCSHPMYSLNNLKRVVLVRCQNLTSLTPLGKMLRLECLHIDSMDNVQRVDQEFLGTNEGDEAVSFPRLEELRFDKLPSWTEWTDVRRSSVMPCLISLKISGCSGLLMLPEFLWTITVLLDLEIDGCHENLEQHCRELQPNNLNPAQVFHIPNIKINGEIVRRRQAF